MAKFYVKKDAQGNEVDRKPVKRGRPPKGYEVVDDSPEAKKVETPAVEITPVATPEVADAKEVKTAEDAEETI
jgi:hypothetical protein